MLNNPQKTVLVHGSVSLYLLFNCSQLMGQSSAAQNTVPSKASSSQSPHSISPQSVEISPEVSSHT